MDFNCKYEVVVVGAGIAGVAAALAAARRGRQVALVEKQALIGGLATSGLIYVYLPLCDGNGQQVIFGIAEELLQKSRQYGPFDYPSCWGGNLKKSCHNHQRYQVEFAPAGLVLTLDALLAKAGVDLWLDTRCCAVQQQQERITAIEVENNSGRGLLQASCFVDASGDALLVRRAGGEVYTDYNNLSMWVMELSPHPERYLIKDSLHIQPFIFSKNHYAPGEALKGRQTTEMTRLTWAHLRDFYDQSYQEGRGTRANHFPVQLPGMPQFYKLAAASCRSMLRSADDGKFFVDSVGMTGDWRQPGPVWETPLSSLLPEKITGVFCAGRCMGAIEDAWDVYRVIPAAAMTGEAAGLAAALCVEKKYSTHDLPAALIQAELRRAKIKIHLDEVGVEYK